MKNDPSELIKKQVFDNSEELHFYLRDLKQWEAEMKAKDGQLLRAGRAGVEEEEEEEKRAAMTAVRNDEKRTTRTKTDSDDSEKNRECIRSCESNDACSEELVDEQRLKQRAILEKDKGNSFLKIGEFDKAIECYTQGQQLDPYNPLLPANRALAFLKREQFAAAEEDCNLAISMDPNYVKTYQRRAAARLALSKFDQAKADFLEVLRLEPQNKEAKSQLTKVEKILTENNFKTMNTNIIDVLPVRKESHLHSKVPLRRIEVQDIAYQVQSNPIPQPVVPVELNSVHNADLSAKRVVPCLPKPPLSSYEFQIELRRLKSYPELVYRYIKEIPCKSYAQFFQHNLESESLSQMFNIFRDFYMWNNDDMYDPLFNLSQTKRFPMLKMFFSEDDKRVLREIFDHLMQTQAYSTEQLRSLERSYEI